MLKEQLLSLTTVPLLDDNYKIIHENLKTWIAYIENIVVQGHIDFQVKVVKTVEPLHCRIR